MRLVLLLFTATTLLTAQPRVIKPAGAAKPVGPYSPALDLGNYVYVSGQGARDSSGAMPDGIEDQTRLCLANVRANLQAAGLDFSHVAAAQLYLTDLSNLPAVERLWTEAFSPAAPPRITLGVAQMPVGTTVEITVVARRKPGVRVYLNAIYGQTRQEADDKLKAALKAVGLAPKHLAMANWYTTGSPEAGVISVAALPDNARWAVSAIASKRKEDATVFCEVVSSSGSGTVGRQTTEAFNHLRSCLDKRNATLADLVATNVYLDDIKNFTEMNDTYAGLFTGLFPTRTTVQPAAPAQAGGPAVRLSAIAEKR